MRQALRPCTYPGCGVLVESGKCERHRKQARRELDARRGTAHQRGYTGRWQRYREAWLARHPLCGDRLDGASAEHSRCVAQGRVTAATDVDHIKPHRGDSRLFWDPKNHQSLCGPCHDHKTATLDRGEVRALEDDEEG